MKSLFFFVLYLLWQQVAGIFWNSSLNFSNVVVRIPLEINISVTLIRDLLPEEALIVKMPRFTRRLHSGNNTYLKNLEFGEVIISPSINYVAAWREGTLEYGDFNSSDLRGTPYARSELLIMSSTGQAIAAGNVAITVHKENGFGAWCGFPGSFEFNRTAVGNRIWTNDRFVITTNMTLNQTYYPPIEPEPDIHNVTSHYIDSYPGVGIGCKNQRYCSGHGACDWCFEKCHCFDGYGSKNDLVTVGRDLDGTCSRKVCPSGKAIGDVATAYNKAHAQAECSNMGICDRKTGTCNCFPPFTGAACERMRCPNDCSGHGQCLSMQELAKKGSYQSPSYAAAYGTTKFQNEAWDYDVIFGCLCDSSWPVGFEPGDTQLSEWFGPDCSLRHCPSGDNPYTAANELNCQGIRQDPRHGEHYGHAKNRCQVDCSNRGICDYETGKCTCFEGSWGDACDQITNAGKYNAGYATPRNASEYEVLSQ